MKSDRIREQGGTVFVQRTAEMPSQQMTWLKLLNVSGDGVGFPPPAAMWSFTYNPQDPLKKYMCKLTVCLLTPSFGLMVYHLCFQKQAQMCSPKKHVFDCSFWFMFAPFYLLAFFLCVPSHYLLTYVFIWKIRGCPKEDCRRKSILKQPNTLSAISAQS